MRTIGVYFAGKIKKNCWRHDLFPGLRNYFDPDDALEKDLNVYELVEEIQYDLHEFHETNEEKLIKIVNDFRGDPAYKIKYSGPFFVGCDHGCFHGENSHGCGLNNITTENACGDLNLSVGCSCTDLSYSIIEKEEHVDMGYEISLLKKNVVESCIKSIKRSDFIFCWIDNTEIFGTLFELGVAKTLNIPIYMFIDESLKNSKFDTDIWFSKINANVVEYVNDHEIAMEKFENFAYDYILKKSKKSKK
jgi:hypothetical protein